MLPGRKCGLFDVILEMLWIVVAISVYSHLIQTMGGWPQNYHLHFAKAFAVVLLMKKRLGRSDPSEQDWFRNGFLLSWHSVHSPERHLCTSSVLTIWKKEKIECGIWTNYLEPSQYSPSQFMRVYKMASYIVMIRWILDICKYVTRGFGNFPTRVARAW